MVCQFSWHVTLIVATLGTARAVDGEQSVFLNAIYS
jgi:hypothetical protein